MYLMSETGRVHQHAVYYCRCFRLIHRCECSDPTPPEVIRATRCTHRDSFLNKHKSQKAVNDENNHTKARVPHRNRLFKEAAKAKKGR